MLDLSKWIAGEYSLASTEEDEDEDEYRPTDWWTASPDNSST